MKFIKALIFFYFFSFISVLLLLYYGGMTRKIEKDINQIKSEITKLENKIKINELEFVIHTNPNYLKKLDQLYLYTKVNENKNLNIISIHDFKTKNMKQVLKISSK